MKPTRIERWFWTMMAVFVGAAMLVAQSFTGAVTGTITDPSGAAVPNAKLVALDESSNLTTKTQSDVRGVYWFPSLRPGTYRIEAEAPGFRKLVYPNIEVRVNDRLEVNMTMTLGPVSESVEVSAAPPLVETQTGAIGNVIENKKIVNLPLNQRNPFQLALLSPGVVPGPNFGNEFNNSANFLINGNRGNTSEILIDGITNSVPAANPILVISLFPSPDALEEFKVQTNGYAAEFGRSGGGIVNMVIKSGTNQFHGVLYEFLRNSRFDAASLGPVERAVRRAPRRTAVHSVTGERRQLYFGDLHNHLLVDDGHQGSVDQLFAFHRDRFASDFAATTSHGDSNKLLISELAQNDLLTEVNLAPGRFIAIPGFEWTQGDFVVPRAGHRHIIYETPGGPLYRPTEGYSDSIREFTELMSKTNGMIFAHHISRASAGGTDWSYTNIAVEPAVEMCSSWGRFEYYQNPGHIRAAEMKNSSVQDAWRMGWRLGVIGGSDGHNLFGDRIQGLTGVYATELTRPAIFEAIRKRRCYATTGEPIQVDFRVNGHLMGSEIAASDGPLVEAGVEGTATLIRVEVVKFDAGKYAGVYRAPLDGPRAKVWWKDPDFRASAFYYLRVEQEVAPAIAARYTKLPENPFPSEMAWTSPVWVNKNQ